MHPSFLSMDDHNLSRLIADTPSRCILLLEDIDCAFPSREDDEDEEPQVDQFGNPVYVSGYQPHSQVTLSGLLNVLDSVTSEEGRIVFATVSEDPGDASERCIDGSGVDESHREVGSCVDQGGTYGC
jgi:hypothetical protein